MDVAGKALPVLTGADSVAKVKEYSELMLQQLRPVAARIDVTVLTQSIPDSAWTALRFQTTARETDTGMGTDAGGYLSGITPPAGGIYMIQFAAGVGGLNNPSTQALGIRVAVAGTVQATLLLPPSISGGSASLGAVAQVNAGQLVSADIFQKSGAARTPSNGVLTITRLSAPLLV